MTTAISPPRAAGEALPRTLLWLAALAFAGFGLAFLARPAAMIAATEISAQTPGGRTEIRAMYGGVQLGLAGFFVWCTRRPERFFAGLLLSLLTFGGLAGARLGGLAIEGVAPRFFLGLAALEVAGTLLAAWGLRRLARG